MTRVGEGLDKGTLFWKTLFFSFFFFFFFFFCGLVLSSLSFLPTPGLTQKGIKQGIVLQAYLYMHIAYMYLYIPT
ncbi:hypothetical protein ACSS6W_002309 [Trichoderma asperelloides]